MRKRFLPWVALTMAVLLVGLSKAAKAGTIPQNGTDAPSVAANSVPNGTHFLVRLDDELSTGKHRVNKKFEAKTLEPLETSDGYVLPPGAKIRGHLSRIEPAGLTGRARMWLTFDDIDTHHGRLPLVAEVSSVPGDFGVKPGESKEGEIEARTSKGPGISKPPLLERQSAPLWVPKPRTAAKVGLRELLWEGSRD